MAPWSVSARAGISSSLARATSLAMEAAPSSSEYSECVCRWTNPGMRELLARLPAGRAGFRGGVEAIDDRGVAVGAVVQRAADPRDRRGRCAGDLLDVRVVLAVRQHPGHGEALRHVVDLADGGHVLQECPDFVGTLEGEERLEQLLDFLSPQTVRRHGSQPPGSRLQAQDDVVILARDTDMMGLRMTPTRGSRDGRPTAPCVGVRRRRANGGPRVYAMPNRLHNAAEIA